MKKQQFLYNPDNPKLSFDVYINKNPNNTISIKYKTLDDVKQTIKKLEQYHLKKKYSHKRLWQVGMILYVRLKVIKNKKPKQFRLAERYFKFLKKRTKDKVDHFFSPENHLKMFPEFKYTTLNNGLRKIKQNFEDELK